MIEAFEKWWKTVADEIADQVGSGDHYSVAKQAAWDAWEKAFVIGRTAGWQDGYADCKFNAGEGISA